MHRESQRDSVTKPRVARATSERSEDGRHELPWVTHTDGINPRGVVAHSELNEPAPIILPGAGRNPGGVVDPFWPFPQGSSCLATLGWRTQSLWDWKRARRQHFDSLAQLFHRKQRRTGKRLANDAVSTIYVSRSEQSDFY